MHLKQTANVDSFLKLLLLMIEFGHICRAKVKNRASEKKKKVWGA